MFCDNARFDVNNPGFHQLPDFLKRENYKNPTDPSRTAWREVSPSNMTLFEFFGAFPDKAESFSHAMRAHSAGQTSWIDLYPTEELVKTSKQDMPIVVDVGGNLGYDLQSFATKHPGLPLGSLVLQDLPAVIEQTKVESPIVAMDYDFFKPQPVKGKK